MSTVYFAFGVLRAGQVFWDRRKPLNNKFYMTVATMVFSLPMAYNFTVATTTAEFSPFLRGYLQFLRGGNIRKFQRKWAFDERSPYQRLQNVFDHFGCVERLNLDNTGGTHHAVTMAAALFEAYYATTPRVWFSLP